MVAVGESSFKSWGVVVLLVGLALAAFQLQGNQLQCKLDKEVYYQDKAALSEQLKASDRRNEKQFDELKQMLRDLMQRIPKDSGK